MIECGHRPGDDRGHARQLHGPPVGGVRLREQHVGERNALIEDNYIHDPIPCCTCDRSRTPTRSRCQAEASNITIRHNTIYGGYINQQDFGNSAITTRGWRRHERRRREQPARRWRAHAPLAPRSQRRNTWTNNRFSRMFVCTVGGFFPVTGAAAAHHSGTCPRDGQPISDDSSDGKADRSAQHRVAPAPSSAAQPSASDPTRRHRSWFLIVCAPAERDANSRDNC